MIIEKLTNEQLARSVTHFIYRNTNIIENSHSEAICMSEDFYKVAHKVVARNITYTKKFLKILANCES